jgi:hypothetical protein
MARYERLLRRMESGRHAIFEWMVISAAISVLVLSYHMFRSMRDVALSAQRMEKAMAEQNSLLEQIHHSIHAEGSTMSAEIRGGKK